MALSNSEVAAKVVDFLKKYFTYNSSSHVVTFDLASFNNNIQSYLADLRTQVMLAVSGDYDGASDYTLNSSEELNAAAGSILSPVDYVFYNLFGFNSSDLLGDDSGLRQILASYIRQWRAAGVSDPINSLAQSLNNLVSSASNQQDLQNLINERLIAPFVSSRGIQTTAALAGSENAQAMLSLLPALGAALSTEATSNLLSVAQSVIDSVNSDLGNATHLTFAITGSRLDFSPTLTSFTFTNNSPESIGSSGADDLILLSGAGDSVYSGAGNDFIIIVDGTPSIRAGTVTDPSSGIQYATVTGSTFTDNHNRQYIGLSTASSATIVGFENGTLPSSDAIYLIDADLSDLQASVTSDSIIINNKNGGSLTLLKNDSALLPSVSSSATSSSTLSDSAGFLFFGEKANLPLGDYSVALTAQPSNLSASQSGITFEAQDSSPLSVVLSRGDTTVAAANFNISNGSINFNSQNNSITFAENTSITTALGTGASLTSTIVNSNATINISTSAGALTFTPATSDGSLGLTLALGTSSLSANLEVLSGSFSLGTTGTLTVAKDTELKIDFGNDYVIDFKVTDDAGGAISLGTSGLSFSPNSDDGALSLSVTRDGQTRTTSLNVTGSITYNLDGSISLSQGTIVKNVFEDGNILTITANTDASGSITFDPTTGLTITPSSPDALSVVLTSGSIDVFNITSINGTINYKSGIITASDGTTARLTNYYMDSEMELRTSGGESSIEMTADSTIYTPGDGATFVLDYLDGSTVEITNGKFIDDYEHAIICAGSVFRTNDDEGYFILETAGEYTLNDVNITTTQDNTRVRLSNYDTVEIEADSGITYNGAVYDSAATLTATPDAPDSLLAAASVATSMMLLKTDAGYPVIAGLAFNPTTYYGDEPTNYSAKENWSITSADGLKLNAIHYTPENSNDKWVVIIHGYGQNHAHMYPFAQQYLENNYNVLLVDQRAAGDSEGTWLTMGNAESADIALWTQEIARRNSNAKITLHGVSMGAATAMLAASRSDTENVTSLIEDCGYTNVFEVINVLRESNALLRSYLPDGTVELMDYTSGVMTGYKFSGADPIDSIGAATMPSMFITGSADEVMPATMLSALYDASGATVKEQLIIDGATHGEAILTDPVSYSNGVFKFIAEADNEGWATNNTVDSLLLTGTALGDTITNSSADNVTIQALGGDDLIFVLNSSSVLADSGDGNDIISTILEYSTVDGLSDYSDLSVSSGAGDDTIVNWGGNYPSLVAGDGDDVIFNRHGYYSTIDAGAGNDSINISNGHYQSINGGDGDDTITAVAQVIEGAKDWAMGGYATLLGGDGNDLITPIYSNNAYIDGGAGDDTIITNGKDSTITGGTGSNFISLTSAQSGTSETVVLSLVEGANDTVYGFKGLGSVGATVLQGEGWGNLDTLHFVDGATNKAVGFTDDGLSFWTATSETDSLRVTFPDIKTTTLLNLKYGTDPTITEAFVSDGDIYQVSQGAADIYVGALATPHQGLDFSGVENAIVTVDGFNGAFGNATLAQFDTIIGDSGTTFILNNNTLTGGDSATIITSSDGTQTITGHGDWKLNNSTVTLSDTTSLISSDDGFQKLTAAQAAYEQATVLSGNVYYNDTDSAVTLTGTSANEVFIAKGGEYIVLGGGTDTIAAVNTEPITVSGYDARTGSTFLTNTSEPLINLIMFGEPYLLTVDNGRFKADGLGEVILTGTDTINGTFVNFTQVLTGETEGTTQLYGWSGREGSNVDGSDYGSAVLIGVAPLGYSTLKGGAGDDTIYAAADDVVNLSGGNDIIDIDHTEREWRVNGNLGGLTINLDTNSNSNTTVKGFDTSFDKLTLADLSALNFAEQNNNLQLSVGNSTLTFENVTDGIMINDGAETYTIHTAFDNLTPSANYILETSDGTYETPDLGLRKKDNEYTYTSGKQTITSFNFGAGGALAQGEGWGTSKEADTLIFNSNLNSVTYDSEGNLKLKTNDSHQLQLSDGKNKVIKLNASNRDMVVEFGDNLTYDSAVNYYGDNVATKIKISADNTDESAAIYANGADGKTYLNVKDIDASAYSGRASLAGNDMNNIITASKGNSSLWGGSGSESDTLVGSEGYNEFFYLKGNGNDVIKYAKDTDLINLMDISLSDISSAEISGTTVKINFNDGGSLSMQSFNDLTFKLADGTRYTTDKLHKTWK